MAPILEREITAEKLAESAARMSGNGQALAVKVEGTEVRWREVSANAPWPAGAAVYSAPEMLAYVTAPPEARSVMRQIKELR